ncbi:Hypothetical protein CINCED_3A019929 [Cinara cedri]|uniref:Uncharacterized protein n=1 Tax=Cinara cedri TaxID=506608 RepID=A0A5E4MKL5_9HEMI|nr:Hypothetical protein CINCED_3A019929 [Cinara cedri]
MSEDAGTGQFRSASGKRERRQYVVDSAQFPVQFSSVSVGCWRTRDPSNCSRRIMPEIATGRVQLCSWWTCTDENLPKSVVYNQRPGRCDCGRLRFRIDIPLNSVRDRFPAVV